MSMGNVRPFLHAGENLFHLWMRSVYLNDAEARTVSMRVWIIGYLDENIGDPAAFRGVDCFESIYHEYDVEIEQILTTHKVVAGNLPNAQAKVTFCCQRMLQKLMAEHKVTRSDITKR